jgi:hypothetical protein
VQYMITHHGKYKSKGMLHLVDLDIYIKRVKKELKSLDMEDECKEGHINEGELRDVRVDFK